MRRRTLLASLAATTSTVGASGCLSSAGSLLPGRRTVGPGDDVTLGGSTFELGAARTQVTFVDQKWPFWDAEALSDHCYVAIELSQESGDADPGEAVRNARIAGELDGERVARPKHVLANRDDQDPVLVGVPFPTGTDADDATVAFETSRGGRYELDASIRDALTDPPALTVDPHVPDTIDGNALSVSLDVTNDGDTSGILAWTTTHSYIADAWWTHRSQIPAGETHTVEQAWNRLGNPDSGSELGIRLDWGYDERQQDVVVARD